MINVITERINNSWEAIPEKNGIPGTDFHRKKAKRVIDEIKNILHKNNEVLLSLSLAFLFFLHPINSSSLFFSLSLSLDFLVTLNFFSLS